MCRILAYWGDAIAPAQLIYAPVHSLEIQSYRPQETITTTVNADGVGLGWYDLERAATPFTYRSVLPIWNDINLPSLSHYVRSRNWLAYVRSATPGQATDLSNCQPFTYDRLSFIHNGFIEQFRQTLYRPIRDRLTDRLYQAIAGTTDSEHIFALIVNHWLAATGSLVDALNATLADLTTLAKQFQVAVSANLVISDGHQLIACRFAIGGAAPSLYWLAEHPQFPCATLIASEPLFPGDWQAFPDPGLLVVDAQGAAKLSS